MKITSNNTYFCADTHFGHANLARGTSKWLDLTKDYTPEQYEYFLKATRDFATIEEMNETIVNNINATVGENDILFHMGDWSLGGWPNIAIFRDRIKCKNIHLVLGNHDENIAENKNDNQKLFTSVNQYLTVSLIHQSRKYKLTLMHYPFLSWENMNKGAIHLFGHVHSEFKGVGRCMDCGMDSRPEFKPYSFNEILDIVGRNPIISNFPNDHHEHEF